MKKNSEKNKKIWTILDLLQWGTNFFAEKRIENPRLNIELLICSVLNIERIELYLQFDRPLKKIELSDLKEKVLKRASGYPLQYIIGYTNFLGYNIKVSEAGLIPRPETEILANCVLNSFENNSEYRILDIGTGSGCLAIALAKRLPNSELSAIDISNEALSLAKENSILNKVENIKFFHHDIFKTNSIKKQFDLIVSNPPYISNKEYQSLESTVKEHEPKIALTDDEDGLKFYKLYSKIFPMLLKEDGKFFLEIGFEQSEEISKIFPANKYRLEFVKDFNNIERVLIGSFASIK